MIPPGPVADSDPSVLEAPNPTYLWTQLLVEELVRMGVRRFFVAPGSRSTPLTVAVARHSDAEVILHVDERGAAFAALGVGRATQRPAAWITTSGTAVANGLPAAVEAATDGVPLLLLTSDRPPELRDTGANQTIDQVKIFGEYVRWQVDVPPPSNNIDAAYVLTTAAQAVHRATRSPAGPVHLNWMFRKPLEPVESDDAVSVPPAVREWAEGSEPFTNYPPTAPVPSADGAAELCAALADVKNGLLVVGRLDTDEEVEATLRLANHLGWPLLPDVTSRLRFRSAGDEEIVSFGDLVLTSETFREAHRPEAVVHVGGRYASKRLRLFLRDSRPSVRAVIRSDPTRFDPDHRVTHHVEADLSLAVEGLVDRVDEWAPLSEWADDWAAASRRAQAVVRRHVDEADELTEPLVASVMSEVVPAEHAIVAASSMPVRDLNRHALPGGADRPVHANRGASGIDGTVSTAAGVAAGRTGPVTLLIGDLALWHDLNGLALLDRCPVIVIVVNNDGGGIFHFLPISEQDDVFEPYFTTPQERTFEQAAATFGLPYHRPNTPEAFRDAYREASRTGGSALIEVQTDREENEAIHEALEREVAEAVDDGLRP